MNAKEMKAVLLDWRVATLVILGTSFGDRNLPAF